MQQHTKMSEESAMRREKRTVSAVSTAKDCYPVVNFGVDGRIVGWNKAAEKRYGYSAEEAVGRDVSLIMPREDSAVQREILANVLEGHTVAVHDMPRLTKKGVEIEVDLVMTPMLDSDGSATGATSIYVDPEERVRRGVRAAYDELTAVIDAAPVMIYVKDPGGRYRFVNKEWEKMTGIRREDATGRTSREILPVQLAEQMERTDGLVEEGADEAKTHLTIDSATGRRSFKSRVSAILDESGRLREICGAASDVTDLDRLLQSQRDFVRIASHDLREPLRSVKSFLGMLVTDLGGLRISDEARHDLDMALSATERMERLIADLRRLTRVETKDKEFAKTDMEQVVASAVGALDCLISENGADVLCADLPLLSVDKTQMESLFENLIANALKYRGEGAPRVEVRAVRKDHAYEFSVKDNGQGFDPRLAERIFRPSQRATIKSDGSGMGLAIAKAIVERHAGQMWAESEPGTGSTFYFTIPDVSGEAHHESK